MKKAIVLSILIIIFLLWGYSIDASGQKYSRSDHIEAFRLIDIWLEAQREYEQLPGISAAIVENQNIIWAKGFGFSDLEKEVNTTANTIYSICSISKLFTSVAIMQLYDAGKLRLDDLIEDVLPWYNIQQQWKDSGPITIRSLLSHSSGLPRESDYPYWTGPDFPFPSQEQIKSMLGNQRTLYPSSTYFQYSNLGLILLGEIVTYVSGIPFDQYVYENILNPLRLTETRVNMPESLWRGILSTGYSALRRDGTRTMLNLFQTKGVTSAAGFSSTVLDLARFASWQFRLLEKGGQEIIKASTLREMYRVHWVDPDWETTWGLGFHVYKVNGKTMVGHGGSCPGYRSILEIDPDKRLAFIVMINAQGVNPEKYAKGMREILQKAEDNERVQMDKRIDLEDYTGYYDEQPWWGESAVIPWQGNLAVLRLPSEDPAGGLAFLQHIDGDTFRRIRKDGTLGEEVIFERGETGKVVRLWRHSNYHNKIR